MSSFTDPKPWTPIDHTADAGVKVTGTDPADLFQNGAMALYDLILDQGTVRPRRTRTVEVTGHDEVELWINWLRALLEIWTIDHQLVAEVRITAWAPQQVRAQVATAAYDPACHPIGSDIKAVTFHQARVEQAGGQWVATAIFDV